ncbi:biliverdin-producing heme oxygenase [Sphingobacterium composti Ten et al. 2007 non Yoo et al. 2007]|uniref:biliverdin-producing heme oxygenase n=1 Tax=Sphingobacterium composti TaxID=363260 RepID=UPI0013584FEF|nr:biliverdin-producing heme oxygenase [Sphingobacterium composti Ten et al. 2007 non Yoo et al. 2007]
MNSKILKTETQDLHDKIEEVMNSQLLFSNQFTLDHYQNLILKSYNYIAGILPKVSSDWPEFKIILEQKLSALYSDLKHLSIIINNLSPVVINNTNRHYKLGLIYIVLGAMLGNKMILKKLHEYQTFKGFPFVYLSQHQEDLSKIWKEFQTLINGLEEIELQKVIQGARDGYLLFGK